MSYDLQGIDPELLRAAQMQPVVDLADPLRARAVLARAARISSALLQRSDRSADGMRITDREITAPAGHTLRLRVYDPVDRPQPSAALLFFHGGAFVAGDLNTEDPRCRRLATDARALVVSVEYRLAPEHPFPAGFDDCYHTLEWLGRHAPELGVDAARLAVGGSSAGGALAAAVALAARDRRGPAIALQMLLYPVVDDRLTTPSMRRLVATPGWNQPNSVHMWNHYLGVAHDKDSVSPWAAPARAGDLANLPSAYVMTAERDPLRDEGIAYARALIAAGVPTELHNIPGAFHGFDAAAPTSTLGARTLAEQVTVLAAATPAAAEAVGPAAAEAVGLAAEEARAGQPNA